jgi:hypothetical protein
MPRVTSKEYMQRHKTKNPTGSYVCTERIGIRGYKHIYLLRVHSAKEILYTVPNTLYLHCKNKHLVLRCHHLWEHNNKVNLSHHRLFTFHKVGLIFLTALTTIVKIILMKFTSNLLTWLLLKFPKRYTIVS